MLISNLSHFLKNSLPKRSYSTYLYFRKYLDMNLSTITNNTCPEDGKIEELPLGTFVQVFGVLSYFLGRLGNFLLLGIVHYEKFGQDPQKRSLPDQLFTFRSQSFTPLMVHLFQSCHKESFFFIKKVTL